MKNYSRLLDLVFAGSKLSRAARVWQRIGTVCLGASLIALSGLQVFGYLNYPYANHDWLNDLLSRVFAYGLMAGLFIFAIVGVYYIGQQQARTTFSSAISFVALRVFLYILLPCIVVCALIVWWGIATHQPAFNQKFFP